MSGAVCSCHNRDWAQAGFQAILCSEAPVYIISFGVLMITFLTPAFPQEVRSELTHLLLAETGFALKGKGGRGTIPRGLASGQSEASLAEMERMTRCKDPVSITHCRNGRKMKNENMKLQK